MHSFATKADKDVVLEAVQQVPTVPPSRLCFDFTSHFCLAV